MIALAVGVGALVALTLANMLALSLPVTVQMLLLTVGVVGVGWPGRRGHAVHRQATRTDGANRWPYFLLAVGGVALAVRVWNLEFAVHFFVDEINFAEAVTRLRDMPSGVQILAPFGEITQFAWVYPYWQALAADVFGAGLVALRLPSALLGVATVWAVGWLVWELGHGGRGALRSPAPLHDDGMRGGGRGALRSPAPLQMQIPLIAALFIATYPPHIHFSRLGLNNIADPFFGTLALAIMVRAARIGAGWRTAGALLGLSAYFYEGGRLVFPALALLWIAGHLLATPHRKATLCGALIMFGAALTVAAPVFVVSEAVAPRLAQRGPASAAYWNDAEPGVLAYLHEHLGPAMAHVVVAPDGSEFFYGGDTALVLAPLVPIFVVGVAGAWRRQEPLPVLWLLLTILGNSLLQFSDWSARYVMAFPAVVVLLAWGWVDVWAWAYRLGGVGGGRGFRRGIKTRSAEAATTQRKAMIQYSLLAVIALGQSLYYFGPHLTRYNEQVRPAKDHQDVIFRARDLPPGAQVHLITDAPYWEPHMRAMLRFYEMDTPLAVLPRADFSAGYVAALPRDVPHAFFFHVEYDLETLDILDASDLTLAPPGFSPYASVPQSAQYALILGQ